ncbi:hypothetical protein DXG01_002340 [Tephrocybe rancida]|nr:hypothetical protein DXG01_002340 [Tephrocybe rancida]
MKKFHTTKERHTPVSIPNILPPLQPATTQGPSIHLVPSSLQPAATQGPIIPSAPQPATMQGTGSRYNPIIVDEESIIDRMEIFPGSAGPVQGPPTRISYLLDRLNSVLDTMSTATGNPSTPHKKCTGKKKTQNEQAQFDTLAKITKANVNKYTKVKNTSKAYQGHIKFCELGIPTDDLKKALSNPPNEYSAMVVKMFITEKCFLRKCKEGVAKAIHAAFCWYWDTMDGYKYAGDYKFNEETREVSGCPAQAACVVNIKKATKNHGKSSSATREHTQAFGIEDMQKLMRYLEQHCSSARLEALRSRQTSKGENHPFEEKVNSSREPLTVDKLLHLFEHGFMKAFSASAFILWTTKKAGRMHKAMTAQGQDMSKIDMYSHMLRWIQVLEALLGRPLEPEDQLFPHISTNSTIYLHQEMSYDSFSKMMHKFTTGAKLTGVKACAGLSIRYNGGEAGQKEKIHMLISFEDSHGDALHPLMNGFNDSFMEGHLEATLVMSIEIRELKRSVNEKLAKLDHGLDQKMNTLDHRSTLPISVPSVACSSDSDSRPPSETAEPDHSAAQLQHPKVDVQVPSQNDQEAEHRPSAKLMLSSTAKQSPNWGAFVSQAPIRAINHTLAQPIKAQTVAFPSTSRL